MRLELIKTFKYTYAAYNNFRGVQQVASVRTMKQLHDQSKMKAYCSREGQADFKGTLLRQQ